MPLLFACPAVAAPGRGLGRPGTACAPRAPLGRHVARAAAQGGLAARLSQCQDAEGVWLAMTMHCLTRAEQASGRLLVGIAGVPGSGKSTTAHEVAQLLNEAGTAACVLPMDGFHLYKSQLDAMPDPAQAHARRGAHWVRPASHGVQTHTHVAPLTPPCARAAQTFDGRRFVEHLRALRHRVSLRAPSFDHGVGDPVEEDIEIGLDVEVVLCEGNYLLLPEGPWGEAMQVRPGGVGRWDGHAATTECGREGRTRGFSTQHFDETWFIDCDLETAMGRVQARQLSIGLTPEQSRGDNVLYTPSTVDARTRLALTPPPVLALSQFALRRTTAPMHLKSSGPRTGPTCWCRPCRSARRGTERVRARVRQRAPERSREHPTVLDDHALERPPRALVGCRVLDLPHDVHALQHAAEDHVAAVQPGRGPRRDEELAPVRVGARVGHGQAPDLQPQGCTVTASSAVISAQLSSAQLVAAAPIKTGRPRRCS